MKHNNFRLVIFISLIICSCAKKPMDKQCYVDFTGFSLSTDTNLVFPFGTENFWIYDDSLKRDNDTAIRLITDKFLFKSTKLYQIENDFYSIEFNQWKSFMTLKNDTIYFSQRLTDVNALNCYEHHAFLFETDRPTYLNDDKTVQLYPQNGIINTKLGQITYNYIYYAMPSVKNFINTKIGIVREEVFSSSGEIIRSKTLNNYYIK